MIGRFSYATDVFADHVMLELMWDGLFAKGRVIAPSWVIEALEGSHISIRPDDELLALPIALSYAVLVTASCGAPLTLTGDRTAWPEEWGGLKDRDSAGRVFAISP